MIRLTIENFSVAQICKSGQCFRMNEKSENRYSVIAGNRYLELEQQGKQCTFYCDEDEFHQFWKGYFDLEVIQLMPYSTAKEELLKLYGVGEKVADCICLFALHQLEAFPVDTHINQALQRQYRQGFPMKRYQGCQGVLQQYIFYYELYGNKEILL